MRPSLFLLLALTSVAAAATAPKCDNSTLPTTAATLENPGQVAVGWLFGEGVRLYDCSSGKPALSSNSVLKISGGPGPGGPVAQASKASAWTGFAYYPNADGNGVLAVNDTSGILPAFNVTLNYTNAVFVPSPDGALDWVRWTVTSTPEEVAAKLNFGWVARVDTVGGATPKSCVRKDKNNEVKVPFTCYYYMYPCPEDKGHGPSAAPPAPPSSAAGAVAGTIAAAIAAAAVLAF